MARQTYLSREAMSPECRRPTEANYSQSNIIIYYLWLSVVTKLKSSSRFRGPRPPDIPPDITQVKYGHTYTTAGSGRQEREHDDGDKML